MRGRIVAPDSATRAIKRERSRAAFTQLFPEAERAREKKREGESERTEKEKERERGHSEREVQL